MPGVWEALARVDQRFHLSHNLPNRKNAILVYHSIGDPTRFGNISVERFRRDLTFLTARYDVVDLPDVLKQGRKKRVALTFDDGFSNFYDHAVPLLREFDCPATVFVSSEFVGDANPDLLSDRHQILQNTSPVMLTETQLRELVADPLISVGNHTKTHPLLSELTDESSRREEIVGGKTALESMLDVEIDRFCYPYGDHDPASVALVRESHALGVTTAARLVGPNDDPALLPRISAHVTEPVLQWELTDLGNAIRTVTRRINGRLTMASHRL